MNADFVRVWLRYLRRSASICVICVLVEPSPCDPTLMTLICHWWTLLWNC